MCVVGDGCAPVMPTSACLLCKNVTSNVVAVHVYTCVCACACVVLSVPYWGIRGGNSLAGMWEPLYAWGSGLLCLKLYY